MNIFDEVGAASVPMQNACKAMLMSVMNLIVEFGYDRVLADCLAENPDPYAFPLLARMVKERDTGVNDRNGQRIVEGDVLMGKDLHWKYLVEKVDGTFRLTPIGFYKDAVPFTIADTLVIIGDKYRYPKLATPQR